MLGNKLSSGHTYTHAHTSTELVMRRRSRQLGSSLLFHLPFSLRPAGFARARPGGLWEGDGFCVGGGADPERRLRSAAVPLSSDPQLVLMRCRTSRWHLLSTEEACFSLSRVFQTSIPSKSVFSSIATRLCEKINNLMNFAISFSLSLTDT